MENEKTRKCCEVAYDRAIELLIQKRLEFNGNQYKKLASKLLLDSLCFSGPWLIYKEIDFCLIRLHVLILGGFKILAVDIYSRRLERRICLGSWIRKGLLKSKKRKLKFKASFMIVPSCDAAFK